MRKKASRMKSSPNLKTLPVLRSHSILPVWLPVHSLLPAKLQGISASPLTRAVSPFRSSCRLPSGQTGSGICCTAGGVQSMPECENPLWPCAMTGAAACLAGFDGVTVVIHGSSGCYYYPATLLHAPIQGTFLLENDVIL